MQRIVSSSFRVRLLFSLTAVALAACSEGTDGASEPGVNLIESPLEREVPSVTDAELQSIRVGNREFAMDLFRAVEIDEPNYLLSPLSIRTAFALLYGGSAGETARDIEEVLHFDLEPDRVHAAFNAHERAIDALNVTSDDGEPETTVRLSNAFFGHEDIAWRDEFLDFLALNYGTGVYSLDLRRDPDAARGVINELVADWTGGHITELVPDGAIPDGAASVLTNALYFESRWRQPFSEFSTRPDSFIRLDGSTVQADFMGQSRRFGYGEGDGYQALQLGYTYPLSMVIILPDAGTFDSFRESLDRLRLDGILDSLDSRRTDVGIPKFRFDTSIGLRDSLRALGMGDAVFGLADFSPMADLVRPSVSDVYHQATIDVDERGTVAAAATAIVVSEDVSAEVSEAQFFADRPFIFLIRDYESDVILFIGQVTDPTAQ